MKKPVDKWQHSRYITDMKRLTDSEKAAHSLREKLIATFTRLHRASGLGLDTFRATVAGEIGVAERTLRYWLDRNKLPKGLSVPAVDRWVDKHE